MKTKKTAKRKRIERGIMKRWNDKPYHSLDYMLRERYGEKVYRVALNGGMSCPNRDGTLGKKAASSAARAEAEILQQTPLFPLQSRSTHRSKVSLPNARFINISPIFRHIQTHMLLWNTCVRSSQKPSPIRISWHCPLVPDRTVWEMMYWSFFIP